MRELVVFKGRTTCPYCEKDVKVTGVPEHLDDHFGTSGTLCAGSRRTYAFVP